jgi:hypothetical protein
MFSPGGMRRARLALSLALPAALAACAGGADTDPAGTWVGSLQTTGGTCPEGASSTLVVSARHLTFAPADGVLTLTGTRDPAHPQALHAQFLGRDMNRRPLPMVFDATFAGGTIDGTFGTPTCRARIALHRPTHSALQRVLGN